MSPGWLYASREGRLLRADCDPRAVAGITRSYLPGPLTISRPRWSPSSPTGSALLFLAIAAAYVVESSVFGGRQTGGD